MPDLLIGGQRAPNQSIVNPFDLHRHVLSTHPAGQSGERVPAASNRLRRTPWIRRQARRIVLFLWWTATLQLPKQFGFWLRARRMRRLVPTTTCQLPKLIESAEPAQIHIPHHPNPTVSIIIPSYGEVGYTLRCLASLAANPPEASIEVIVVDDATPDASTACLAAIDGIRLIVNPRNLGYLHSCNVAAGVATGEYLLLLNNDTQVQPGWLDAMLRPFHTDSGIGAVGSKLLYPDGRLQEAGCIIWSDGSGWNYGRLDDPDKPVYNYRREVDYCSAASLMVPRMLFHELNGFDERYAPAYCEDSDLAFRLREHGYKVVYQPRSHVVHFEGVSHGQQITGGIKAFQVRNQRKFRERWRSALATEHAPAGRRVMRARDRALHRRVVLVVDHYVPQPDRDAGSRTILCCIHSLLRSGSVVKFWPHNQCYGPGYTEALQDIGVEVTYGGDDSAFDAWVAVHGGDVDVALLSRPQVASICVPILRRHGGTPLLYYGHDLHFRRMRQQAEAQADARLARDADRMERLERAVWRAADITLYPSNEETAIVAAMEPGVAARTILPYCFADFATHRPLCAEPVLLFVGGFAHPPNQEAALWFVDAILPLIRQRVPAVKLAIVGSNPSQRLLGLADRHISLCTDVSDAELRTHYRASRVAVVPLRYGAGVKLKVVEALREGLPLVTTPIGAQGLPGLDQVACVRDDARSFADAVGELLLDDALWMQRSAAQLEYAAARYSEAAFDASMLGAIAAVQSPSRCARRSVS
jgi:GT2 family glycosyltransferase